MLLGCSLPGKAKLGRHACTTVDFAGRGGKSYNEKRRQKIVGAGSGRLSLGDRPLGQRREGERDMLVVFHEPFSFEGHALRSG